MPVRELEIPECVQVTTSRLRVGGSGFGLMEVSHRSQTFQDVIDSAMSRLRGFVPYALPNTAPLPLTLAQASD